MKVKRAVAILMISAMVIMLPGCITLRTVDTEPVADTEDGTTEPKSADENDSIALDAEEGDERQLSKESVSVPFNAKVLCTGGSIDFETLPAVFLFDTLEELNRYYEENRENYVFSGLAEAIREYNEVWFSTHQILLVVLREGSGAIRHLVTQVTAGQDPAIEIVDMTPSELTADEAVWHLLIETERVFDSADGIALRFSEDKRWESLSETLRATIPSISSDVYVGGHEVWVNLFSESDGRCELEDIKAIQTINESIRTCGFEDTVETVRICIYDRDRKLLSDHTVHRSEEAEGMTGNAPTAVTQEEIAAYVSGLLEAFPYHTESLSVIPQNSLSVGTMEIVLSTESVSDIRFDEIDSLLCSIQAYSDRNRCLNACSVSVMMGEECVLYAVRDFDFGSLNAWISPAYEETFVSQEGPR